MRRILLLLTTLLLTSLLPAQVGPGGVATGSTPRGVYGNEWYNPARTWYRIQVWEDGIYRITLNDLQAAGINTAALNPASLQVWYRGNQIPVQVSSSGGVLQHLDFWGSRNDGRVDSLLYRDPQTRLPDPTEQANIHNSIFSDSSAYFISWDGGTGDRFTDFLDTDYSSYTPLASFRYTAYCEKALRFYKGGGGDNDIFYGNNSDYSAGEGFTGIEVTPFDILSILFQTPGYTPTGGNPHIMDMRVTGYSIFQHVPVITLNGTEVFRDTFGGLDIYPFQFPVNAALGATTEFFLSPQGGNDPTGDYQILSWATLEYDRSFDLQGAASVRLANFQYAGNTRVQFQNADLTAAAWLYDLRTGTRILGTVSGSTVDFIVPGSPLARDLFFVTDKGLKTNLLIHPTHRLNNLSDPATQGQFLIIAHRFLQPSAEAYALYRDTCTTNPMTSVKVVYTDEIYDEFGYGTPTVMAIKRFIQYATDNWAERPAHVLLWGKSTLKFREGGDLVPTWNHPASDLEYVMNYDPQNLDYSLRAGIGRVNVLSHQEGMDYLNKVMEYEHKAYAPWQKNIGLLGGGENVSEQTAIFGALDQQFRPQITGPPVAARVYYWQRWGNGIETNTNLSTQNAINQGLSILNFFGHSSPNYLDVDLLQPDQYTNFGKYPFIFGFGCYGGDFANYGKSLSERFLLEPGRGAIAYLANSSVGTIPALRDYGFSLYGKLGGSSHRQPFGNVMRETILDYMFPQGVPTNSVYRVNHARQMNLQGDPALVLDLPGKPDYRITSADVYFGPPAPNAEANDFRLNLIVHNDGMYMPDSLRIRIIQTSPQGTSFTFADTLIAPILLQDTLEITLKNQFGPAAAGLNQFRITLDPDLVIDEYYENNNEVYHGQIINGNAPALLYPLPFAIIPENDPVLKVASFVVTASPQVMYEFQIDSVYDFSSPWIQSSGPVTGTAALGEWQLPFSCTPGKVYYWRARLADTYPISWTSGSFQHRSGQEGWAQSVAPQFFEDAQDSVTLNTITREWEYNPFSYTLHAYTPLNGLDAGRPYFFLGPFKNQTQLPIYDGVLFNIINQNTLMPAYRNTTQGDWQLVLSSPGMNLLYTAVVTTAPGDYVLISSSLNPHINTWDDDVLHALESIGCNFNQLRNMQDGDRFIILGRKGSPAGTATVITQPTLTDLNGVSYMDLNTTLSARYMQGNVQSPHIGPATQWDSLSYRWRSVDPTPYDTTRVDLIGIRADFSEAVLLQGLSAGDYDIRTVVDAAQFPFIRLQANLKDHAYRTPPQFEEWYVIYEGVPDATVDPGVLFSFDRDTVQEGEVVKMRLNARNLTARPMDSLLVRYTLERPDRSQYPLGTRRYAALPGDSSITLDFEFHTGRKSLSGDVTFIVEINPGPDQLEGYAFNNYYYHNFHVLNDRIQPVIDATVDGKYIMDGEIVSPVPEILLQVDDDNPWLPLMLADSTCDLYFGKGRSLSLLSPIPIDGNPMIEVENGSLPQNKARIYFRPGRLDDGVYTLSFTAQDATRNPAGTREYIMHFEVVNEKSISQVLNYPNPFSTSTRFVYTLTGDEKPYEFRIQIYTLSGRLVKEIDLLEEGAVYTGYNVSEYAWDGRDEYGDELANGVYLYKTIIKFTNPDEVELRDEGLNSYFEKGFGKMVILR